jgi:hypothetical protein
VPQAARVGLGHQIAAMSAPMDHKHPIFLITPPLRKSGGATYDPGWWAKPWRSKECLKQPPV